MPAEEENEVLNLQDQTLAIRFRMMSNPVLKMGKVGGYSGTIEAGP